MRVVGGLLTSSGLPGRNGEIDASQRGKPGVDRRAEIVWRLLGRQRVSKDLSCLLLH